MNKKKYSRFTICNRCIHNLRDGCEASNDNYMKIVSKKQCIEYREWGLPPNPDFNSDEDE